MKKLFILVFILLQAYVAGAQVTGYLGKRFFVSYSPELYGDLLQVGSGKFFNLRNALRADFIIGRRIAIGAEYAVSKTNNTTDNAFAPLDYRATIKSNKTALVFTFYGIKSPDINAPIGDYLRFKLFKENFNLNDPGGYANWNDQSNTQWTPGPKKGNANVVGFELGYGYSMVIKDVVVLDFGAQLNIFPYIAGTNYTGTTGDIDTDKFIKNKTFGNSIFGINIAIGGLLF